MTKQQYSKTKGREAESAVVEYLRLRGCQAERRRLTGAQDCGDVGGLAGITIEVKAERRLNLAGYMDELAVERENAGKKYGPQRLGFVVAKRRGTTSPGEWYAIVTLSDMVDLVKCAGLVGVLP